MNLEDYIAITPGVRSGKPCLKGTRITVYDVLEYLAGGMTEQQILTDFRNGMNIRSRVSSELFLDKSKFGRHKLIDFLRCH